MIAVLIDLSNYSEALVQSSASRSGSPDGNIFIDNTNGRIELITNQELANIDLLGGIASAPIQIDVVFSAGTYTRISGDFVADGFKKDRTIAMTGFTNGGNNATKIILSVTATVITVTDNSGLVNETGSGDEVVSSAVEANPLDDVLGVRMEALYAFENQERRVDESLRKFDRYFKGTFKFGGAFELLNDNKFDDANGTGTSNTGDDRNKVRGSGWIERNTAGLIGRILYGNVSLGNIESASQPYYQLSLGGSPVNYSKVGDIDEAIQVYGDNNVDANAYTTSVVSTAIQIDVVFSAGTYTRISGDFVADGFIVGHRFDATLFTNGGNNVTKTILSVTATVITVTDNSGLVDETGSGDEVLTVSGIDTRLYESLKIRTFGQNYDEKILADSGVIQMNGYSSGFALGESVHLTTGSFALADVYGGGQIAPFTSMTLEKLVGADSTPIQIDIVASGATYTRLSGSFITDGFAIGQTFTGSNFTNGGNNVDKIILTVTALVITVTDNTGLVNETGSGDEQLISIGQTETGFNESDGVFSWVLNNTANGTLDECVAFLDALAQTDDDIDSGALTVTNGKRVGTWYSYDAQGRILTKSGADVLGLFIEQLPVADQQSIVFTDDAGATKTYPFQVSVVIFTGAIATADILSWYHSYFIANYNTASAVTVEDSSTVDVKGNVSTDQSGDQISFAFDYDGDTVGGTAGTDKDCVFLCEGDGGATQTKTLYTLTRITTVSLSCAPPQENNV